MFAPPQEPEYQNQLAPVPRLPPFAVRVVGYPWQIFDGLAVTDDGIVELKFTETASEDAGPLPQAFDGTTVTFPEVVLNV